MNFYNPYLYSLPLSAQNASGLGALGRLAGGARGLSLGSIISGTQKTLNIINQAIPIIKEASPMMRNAKTMFKIASEFKKADSNPVDNNVSNQTNIEETIETKSNFRSEGGPTFFL